MSLISETMGDELVVVVVGVSGGIGRALTNRLLASEQVVKVYGLSRSVQYYDSYKYSHFCIDYEFEDSIANVAAKLPALDIVLVTTGLLHNDTGLKPEKRVVIFYNQCWSMR